RHRTLGWRNTSWGACAGPPAYPLSSCNNTNNRDNRSSGLIPYVGCSGPSLSSFGIVRSFGLSLGNSLLPFVVIRHVCTGRVLIHDRIGCGQTVVGIVNLPLVRCTLDEVDGVSFREFDVVVRCAWISQDTTPIHARTWR